MNHFTAHRLQFVARVKSTIELGAHQGSAIRGALYHALRRRFCAMAHDRRLHCVDCPLVASCPVATLVSTLKLGGGRGRDVPRPYTIQPPLPDTGDHQVQEAGQRHYRREPGESLTFGLTLYAQAMQLFPYIVLAVDAFEQLGLGRKMQCDDGRWRRGTLTIQEIWAENPLAGERQPVLREGDTMVQVPDVPITHHQILRQPYTKSGRLRLDFLTPARIIERGHLVHVKQFRFQPLFQRLMRRLESLSRNFSDTPLRFEQPRELIEAAGRVRVVENDLRWEEVYSYSSRRRSRYPISGLVGSVTLEYEDWFPFWPWLLWGQFTHVGKDAVKGNGWYRLEVLDGDRSPSGC